VLQSATCRRLTHNLHVQARAACSGSWPISHEHATAFMGAGTIFIILASSVGAQCNQRKRKGLMLCPAQEVKSERLDDSVKAKLERMCDRVRVRTVADKKRMCASTRTYSHVLSWTRRTNAARCAPLPLRPFWVTEVYSMCAAWTHGSAPAAPSGSRFCVHGSTQLLPVAAHLVEWCSSMLGAGFAKWFGLLAHVLAEAAWRRPPTEQKPKQGILPQEKHGMPGIDGRSKHPYAVMSQQHVLSAGTSRASNEHKGSTSVLCCERSKELCRCILCFLHSCRRWPLIVPQPSLSYVPHPLSCPAPSSCVLPSFLRSWPPPSVLALTTIPTAARAPRAKASRLSVPPVCTQNVCALP